MNIQPTPAAIYKNPAQYYEEEVKREVLDRYNTAFEIFMAEQYTRIRYSELMDIENKNYASKQRLLSWINDNTAGRGIRAGILTKYKESHPEHFENGIWQARYFSYFIYYAYKLLTDKVFVRDKKIADEFARSFKDKEWFWQAVALLGAKLLEYLYDKNALKTDIAKAYVRQIKLSRRLLDDIGHITGRVLKNYGTNYGNAEEVEPIITAVRKNIEDTFRQQLALSYQIFKSQREYQFYQMYGNIIKNDVIKIYREEILEAGENNKSTELNTGQKQALGMPAKGWW